MQDPLKQGLKHRLCIFCNACFRIIRMQDPLKQGLKLCKFISCKYLQGNSNARSTKTRIETHGYTHFPRHDTRIRMQDPLKQGLKLISASTSFSSITIRMQDPLKQGLKLKRILQPLGAIRIRMQDPLKQGLKHFNFHYVSPVNVLFECKIH